jgi:LysM domain-containing protein
MTLAMTTAMAVLDVAETGEPAPPRPQVVPERPRVVVAFPRSGQAAVPRPRVSPETRATGARGAAAGRSRPVAPEGARLAVPAAAAQGPAAADCPIRLTRRGRVVFGGLAVAAAAAVACLLSLTLAGGALASNHGAAHAGYRGMRQIVVQPGQTLWSIAAAAAPAADPRLVIPQIEEANSLAGSTVYAGETLWVPGR